MSTRFKTLYGKPRMLTDRYHEGGAEAIARVLAKPEGDLDWQMGFDRDHYDYVEDSQLVGNTLEALLRFRTLGAWAEAFVESLGRAENDPVKSAWSLECVAEARTWVFFRGR